jgi:hypothetical protein
MSASWPTSVATDSTLYIAVNELQTNLSSGINSAVTTITLNSTTSFPTVGLILIDNEIIKYTGISGSNLTGCTRAFDGTTAASHSAAAIVSFAVMAAHHNVLKDEIIALETSLNLTASRAIATDTNGRLVVVATTAAELAFVNGVTSAIQTQLDLKAPKASPTFTGTVTVPPAANFALQTGTSSVLEASATTKTELGYLSGVTSAIQTQMDLKAPKASPTFTGTVTVPNGAAATSAAAVGQLKYLQAVQTTTVTSTSTSSSTFTAATNMTVTITPSSSSNRVKITVSCRGYLTAVGSVQMYVTLKRGSTELSGQTGGFAQMYSGATGSPDLMVPINFTYIDSPATTSATTYSVYFASSNNSTTVSLGAPAGVSVIIAEEIV